MSPAVQRSQLSRRFRPRAACRARHGRSRPSGPARTDYTLAHAGRQFRLGPVTFWIAVGSLVIMAGWSLATGTYFAFHDDVLTRLIARQKEQQFAYEDRIAELRAQVDRITSRQLLDQEQFEQKLEQILRRQATLESRASTLAGVPDPAPTGSIKSRPTPLRRAARPATAQGLADQRHGDLHRAARPRGAAGIARTAGRRRAASPPRPRPRRSASRARWRACRPRSTASSRGRPRRSTRSRSATTPRPSASAAC